MNYVKMSNIVDKDTLKSIQLDVLEDASNAVMCTAGPYGSTTMILQNGAFPTYSKDGKKVLDSIKYAGSIETAILDEISQLVSYVVKEVGDGTTTAIRLSYHIFSRLLSMENVSYPSRTIIDTFNEVVDSIKNIIKSHGRDVSLSDIYKICMISTNGNETISENIAGIYEKYGFNAFIDIDTTSSADSFVKEYDGITLNKGYASNAYINTTEGKCIIHNPKIYYFRDPIDTEETLSWLTNIIYNNIIIPVSGKDPKNKIPTSTVIITPSISRDAEALLADIEKMMYGINPVGRPELLFITKLNRYMDDVEDITKLCGCPAIMKYIDPSVQKKDQELGKAPTINTILDFCGTAEQVEADSIMTKFINPDKMYEKEKVDENGRPIPTTVYTGLINNLESELKQLQESEDDKVGISMIKRRLHALTSTLVQYYIGGIAVSDRDACKDLAEDAVLNCRSAITNGVGYGMCYESLRACNECSVKLSENNKTEELKSKMLEVIRNSVYTYIVELYSTVNLDESTVKDSIIAGCPLNLRTLQFDRAVLSSINTDIVILEAIAKIITNMYTSNQALITDSINNMYMK